MVSIQIKDNKGQVKFQARGQQECWIHANAEYEEGDRICLGYPGEPCFLWFQADDAMPETLLYVKGAYELPVPFGEDRKGYSPKSFSGSCHYLHARVASEEEIYAYRNLALNPLDSHLNETCYPHASANVETRNEAVFAARNAIDGVLANSFHGEWPHNSWGINRDPNAELYLDFGREVEVDRLVIYLRADFPHDNWWKEATVEFSDGSSLLLHFVKTGEAQETRFPAKRIKSLTFKNLIKAEEESPFPALTQIQVYGRAVR